MTPSEITKKEVSGGDAGQEVLSKRFKEGLMYCWWGDGCSQSGVNPL